MRVTASHTSRSLTCAIGRYIGNLLRNSSGVTPATSCIKRTGAAESTAGQGLAKADGVEIMATTEAAMGIPKSTPGTIPSTQRNRAERQGGGKQAKNII